MRIDTQLSPSAALLDIPPHPDGPTCEPIPMPSPWSWGNRAVWLDYVPPHPDPTIEGPPAFVFDDVVAA